MLRVISTSPQAGSPTQEQLCSVKWDLLFGGFPQSSQIQSDKIRDQEPSVLRVISTSPQAGSPTQEQLCSVKWDLLFGGFPQSSHRIVKS